MADWNAPVDNPVIEDMVPELRDRDIDASSWGTAQTITNPFTGMKRWNASNKYWEEWSGSAWVQAITQLSLPQLRLTDGALPGLASTAHALQTGPSSGDNMAIGQRIIQARTNGAAAALHLNYAGGAVVAGENLGASQKIQLIPGATPSITIGGVAVLKDSGTLANARIAESNVTQHEAALTIALAQLSAPAVSNYYSGFLTYLHADGGDASTKNVSSDVTKNAWESYGPTGSGANNIWTALNSIHASASAVILSIELQIDPGSTADASVSAFLRRTGSSASPGFSNRAAILGVAKDSVTGYYISQTIAVVPLDAARRFDITWTSIWDTSSSVAIALKGFVV